MSFKEVINEKTGSKTYFVDGRRVSRGEYADKSADLTANMQRVDSDPILEAEAYELLQKEGKTRAEVAASVGRSEGYVARRMRISSLVPEWRKAVKAWKTAPSVRFLESLAAYSEDLQREAFDRFRHVEPSESSVLDWLSGSLSRLAGVNFCTDDCKSCPFNTANRGLLFAGMFGDDAANCEKRTCFVSKWNAAVDEEVLKLRDKGLTVKEVKRLWDVPKYWDAGSMRDANHGTPYVCGEENGLRKIVWAASSVKVPESARDAKTEAERKEDKERKARHLAWFRARRSAKDKANAALHASGAGDVFERIVRGCVGTPRFNEWVVSYFAKYGPLHDAWSSDEQNAALVGMAGEDALREFGLDFTADEVAAILSDDPNDAK